MRLVSIALLLCALFLNVPTARATEQFAAETGKPCSACHVDPSGGGELTAAGKTFAAARLPKAEVRPAFSARSALRFAAGYLHLLIAILWFGTILYVHLVLKPAYASGGLPRGEVRVGLLSMVVMGITGAILTHFRIPSLDVLLHTRFGVLLLVKIGIYLFMVTTALVVVTVIGPRLKAKRKAPGAIPESGDLTADELAACDGKEGRPAYFAFDGTIYDATGSRVWKDGVHMGRHQAGTDLTEALKLAPHGAEKMVGRREVGKLLSGSKRPLHERVFYLMAYLNLGAVFLIVLIISLWRWGNLS